MANNLELHKKISFDQLIEHGLLNGANIISGIPHIWNINGKCIRYENDSAYNIETFDGYKRFERGDYLIAFESGLQVFKTEYTNTHCPGACPL